MPPLGQTGDVAGDVIADVDLYRRVVVDAGADLGEDFIPGATDLRVEIAEDRAEVLVERLGAAVVPPLYPLAAGQAGVGLSLQGPAITLGLAPDARAEVGPFDIIPTDSDGAKRGLRPPIAAPVLRRCGSVRSNV
jgi:hypothetical protein